MELLIWIPLAIMSRIILFILTDGAASHEESDLIWFRDKMDLAYILSITYWIFTILFYLSLIKIILCLL